MKKVISLLLGILTFLLAIPTSLIIASWNALPGNQMYPVKIQLERIAVRLMGETALARQLEVKYTERRFSEADKLLAQEHSTIGFALVTAQAKTAKEKVIQAQDAKTKETLVNSLIVFNQKLEEKKAEVKSQASTSTIASTTPPYSPTPTPVPTSSAPMPKISPAQATLPTSTPKIVTPTPTPIPAPTTQEPEEIIDDIEETQEDIEEIIEELEEGVSSLQGASPDEQRQKFLEKRKKEPGLQPD